MSAASVIVADEVAGPDLGNCCGEGSRRHDFIGIEPETERRCLADATADLQRDPIVR